MGANMSRNNEGPHWPAEKPSASSEQLNDAPPWSPWNFQQKKRDWHEDFYDERPTSTSHGVVKQPV
jgi:hypothetical protein